MDIKEYLASKLNDEQLKAALHTTTSSLILAGAGSGKTRTLTYKIAYLMFGLQVNPKNILAVTFTNKAANEMKERLIELADEMTAANLSTGNEKETQPSSEGGDDIDDFLNSIEQNSPASHRTYGMNDFKWIGTFHGIFLKILKEDIEALEYGYNKNFSIIDSNDSQSLIKQVLKRTGFDDVFKPNEVKWFISKQKNLGFDPKRYEKQASSDYDFNMFKLYTEYQNELVKSNLMDFDDLLLLAYLLFKKEPDVLAKWLKHFRYIMVDEAQDTNWIQFELMKMMSGDNGNITLIGDDYQSIYGWRWALMENFLNVKQYWPDIVMFKLQINYRSKPHIVNAGNCVIKNNQKQYDKNVSAHRWWTDKDKIMCFTHNTEVDEAANIVDFIRKMKNDGAQIQNWSDVAILYRTNSQSSVFERILVQEGIPYKIWGAFKFFERKEIKDVLSYIKYLLNPADSLSLKRVINVPNRKVGATTMKNLEEYALMNNITLNQVLENIDSVPLKITPMAKNGIMDFKTIMHEVASNLLTSDPSEIIDQLVKKIKYKAHLLKEEWNEEKAEERFENIGQLINMAEKYSDIKEYEDELTWTQKLQAFMEEVSLLSDVADNKSEDADAIKLMTVHSSKWLEFPLVFITWLEDYIFPLSNAVMETHLLEEERRLMYVAVTRAKDHLFLSYANSRMTWGQTKMNPPSRFIEEIPPELLKSFDLWGWSGFWWKQDTGPKLDEWDTVKHKLFGSGYVLEVWNNLAIVKFHNPKFWTRKIENRFLEII